MAKKIFIVSFERDSKILLHFAIDSYALFFSIFQMKSIKFLLPFPFNASNAAHYLCTIAIINTLPFFNWFIVMNKQKCSWQAMLMFIHFKRFP